MTILAITLKATVAMALALAGAWLARRSRASVRHAILASAFAVILLLPIASIVAPPVSIAVPSRVTTVSFIETPDLIPTIAPRATETARVTPERPWPSLSAFWLCGVTISLIPMMIGLLQVRLLRRAGLPWMYGQAAVDRLAADAGIRRRVELLLHEALPGPMTCGVVRPAIMLPPEAQTWEPEDLDRAIVHELEHVRRCDWVTHCLSRVLCAAYWFHPIVWIARRRLALEAERSCDDAVLRRSEATAYADQLVGLARRLTSTARIPVPAMANRADLRARVRAVLDGRQRRGKAGMLSVALAFAAAAVVVVAISPLRIVAAAPQLAPEFDAVSVKLIDPDMQGFHSHDNSDPGRMNLTGTMHMFITRAYGITSGQLADEPDWFKTHLYSIQAVTAARASREQMLLMLRGVLADRFQLKLRQEDRDLPVYSLEVAPGGPKFKSIKPGEEPSDGPPTEGIFSRGFGSITELMNSLNAVNGGRLGLDRTVIDRTGLTGTYNIQLRTDIETQTDAAGRRTVSLPNLVHDIQSELGLKLVPDHAKMPYFVVERAAAPTPN